MFSVGIYLLNFPQPIHIFGHISTSENPNIRQNHHVCIFSNPLVVCIAHSARPLPIDIDMDCWFGVQTSMWFRKFVRRILWTPLFVSIARGTPWNLSPISMSYLCDFRNLSNWDNCQQLRHIHYRRKIQHATYLFINGSHRNVSLMNLTRIIFGTNCTLYKSAY